MGMFDRMKQAQQQAAGAMSGAGAMAQQAMANAGISGDQMAATMGGDMQAQMAYAQLAQKLKDSGVEAPGVVSAIRPSGVTEVGGGQQTEIDVTITASDGTSYDTTVHQSMLPDQLSGLAPGTAVGVKYDPDDRSKALLYSW